MDRKRSGPWQILACTTLDKALTSGRPEMFPDEGAIGTPTLLLPAEA